MSFAGALEEKEQATAEIVPGITFAELLGHCPLAGKSSFLQFLGGQRFYL